MQKEVEDFLRSKRGYLKRSKMEIAQKLKLPINDYTLRAVKAAISVVSKELSDYENYNDIVEAGEQKQDSPTKEYMDLEKGMLKMLSYYIQTNQIEKAQQVLNTLKDDNLKSNVLIIGDIHEPFCKAGYLEFCKRQYKQFNCNKVIFIGDIIDNHYSSFHNTDPDGYGAGEELDRAIDAIAKWYEAFPEATVIIGNHDRLAYRKAFAGGVSKRWLRSYGDILNTPNWKFVEHEVVDNVYYVHGEAGTARMKARDLGMSIVQGHLHSQAYIEFVNNNTFAMQVGTGVNDDLYAFNYNKAGKESILSCGVVLEGHQPILIKF